MSMIFKITISLILATYICVAQAFASPPAHIHHPYYHRSHAHHPQHYRPPVQRYRPYAYTYYRTVPQRRYYDSFGREILRDLTDSIIWGSPYRTNYYYVNYQTPVRTIYVNGTSQSCRECGSVNCSYSGNYDCCECIEYNLGR